MLVSFSLFNFVLSLNACFVFPVQFPPPPPQGFWGSGENGYLFSVSWGALVIILGDLGSKLIILGI